MCHLSRRSRMSRIRAAAQNQSRFPLFARTFRLARCRAGLRAPRMARKRKGRAMSTKTMKNVMALGAGGVLIAGAAAIATASPSWAMPGLSDAAAVKTAASNQVTDVRYYRRHYYRHRYYGRGYYRRGYYGRRYYGGGYGYQYGGYPYAYAYPYYYPYSYFYPFSFGFGWGW